MFETQAQNKRYLGDLVDTLMAEAKDSTDMFEDVALDFRHHKFKPKLEFPEKWKLTEARKAQLEANWQQRALEDQQRQDEGRLIDGTQVIQEVLEVLREKRATKQPVQAPARKVQRKRLAR